MTRRFIDITWLLFIVALAAGRGWPPGNTLPDVCRLSQHCFRIIDEVREPIVVRSVQGDVRFRGDPIHRVTVEVFGPGNSPTIHSAQTDESECFKIEGLSPASYKFHAWSSGFNSVVGRFGRLAISKKAPRNDKIHIAMALGV